MHRCVCMRLPTMLRLCHGKRMYATPSQESHNLMLLVKITTRRLTNRSKPRQARVHSNQPCEWGLADGHQNEGAITPEHPHEVSVRTKRTRITAVSGAG
jgi:hypothetical protein